MNQKSAEDISAFTPSNLLIVVVLLAFAYFLGCVQDEDQRMRDRDTCYATAPDPAVTDKPIDCEHILKEKK